MHNKKQIEEILLQTLEDYQLSKTEKQAITEIFSEYKNDPENFNYFRNRAFDIALDQFPKQSDRQVIKWLEGVMKALSSAFEVNSQPVESKAYFSPGDACYKKIVSLFSNVRKNADICIFTITDDRIKRAIIDAHKRGIQIRLITDDDKANDRGSDVYELSRLGISVRMDNTEHHMHHKFALFDNRQLLTGSFNWTCSATNFNQENIVVTNDPKLCTQFADNFEKLWREFGPIK